MNINDATPISGVKNCHVEGLYSLMFEDGLRMYATTEWTSLAANAYGDALGFHNHHTDIRLKVITGEIENISPVMDRTEKLSAGHARWTWNSPLRGLAGHFVQTDNESTVAPGEEGWNPPMEYVTDYAFRTRLHPGSTTLSLYANEVHTVNQLTRVTAWFVKELGSSSKRPTYTWSNQNLSKWHEQAAWYVPMNSTEIRALWKKIKGVSRA